jgi:hypothetical protein
VRFKLDENLGRAEATVLRDAVRTRGHPPSSSIPLPGPDGRLWVVQPGRVRLYQGEEQNDD